MDSPREIFYCSIILQRGGWPSNNTAQYIKQYIERYNEDNTDSVRATLGNQIRSNLLSNKVAVNSSSGSIYLSWSGLRAGRI